MYIYRREYDSRATKSFARGEAASARDTRYSAGVRYMHGLIDTEARSLARSLSLTPHAVNATRLGVSRRATFAHAAPVRVSSYVQTARDDAHRSRSAAEKVGIDAFLPLSQNRSGVRAHAHARAHALARPYTPRSRSGMNETMISTHGAKVGDSSGGTRCGAARRGAGRGGAGRSGTRRENE